MSFKPIVLDSDGIFGQLQDGAIINAGGTSNVTWTVNGQGLLFEDGTSTSGGTSSLTLQSIYDNTPAVSGSAKIKLSTGKDFIVADDTDDALFFKIDAETGKITITGDLEVLGSSTIIDTIIQDSDHWQITPKLGSTSAIKIEPEIGVTPIVDLVTVRRTFGSTPVFRIDANGNLVASQNITLGGLLNGVDIVNVRDDLNHHLAGDASYRHLADDIDIIPIATLPGAVNVQEALEQINNKIGIGIGGSNTFGYEHVQAVASTVWTVVHSGSSFRIQTTIYDTSWEQIIPDSVKIINNNTILISFASPIAGRAMVILF